MDLKDMQKEIIANRVRRGFPSSHNLAKTTKGLREEIGEWEDALNRGDRKEQIDALGDLIIYCLGGLEILQSDANRVLEEIIENNRTRTHEKIH